MDLKIITDAAGDLVEKAGDAAAQVPGVAQVTDVVQDVVAGAQAHAEKVGLGDMAENVINAVENKVKVDLDGDADVGEKEVAPAEVK
jgi:hypothetical protein